MFNFWVNLPDRKPDLFPLQVLALDEAEDGPLVDALATLLALATDLESIL
jgi:hypothetical protein